MKITYLFVTLFVLGVSACKSKTETTTTTSATSSTTTTVSTTDFANTSWKGVDGNKFPLSYVFKDKTTLEMRDETGEIPNTYLGTYTQKADSIFVEINNDKGGAGATSPMFGYKQTLVYQDNALLLVADQMPMQKVDFYPTPDKFTKE